MGIAYPSFINMGDDKRAMALARAKMAEQAERYDEMVSSMKEIIEMGFQADELSQEERNLISVGYKNLMSERRTSWRTVESQERKAAESNDPMHPHVTAYKATIAKEIEGVIDKVIAEVVSVYTSGPQKAQKPENLVFFYKMQGDYNRYGAEIADDPAKYQQLAGEAYESAHNAGKETDADGESLKKTNPILLGLALNHSVFHFEICREPEKAKKLAQEAFDDALAKLDELPEEQYKDSTLIMQLLKDNLTLWSEGDDEQVQVEDME